MNVVRMIFILILITSCKNPNIIDSEKQTTRIEVTEVKTEIVLVGNWEFKVLQNKNEDKLDTIRNTRLTHQFGGFELVNRADIKFNGDGTYEKQFTPTNIDTGKWEFDDKSNEIIFYLFIDPETFVGKDLIKKGLAVKHSDGKYYERLTEKLISVTENELRIIEKSNRIKVYKRKD